METEGRNGPAGALAKRPRGRPLNDPATTRNRLVEAALDEFGAHGYFRTDTNKIARAASLAPATFYRYFDDKLAVFLTVYAHWVEREWAVIDRALDRRAGSDDVVAEMLDQLLEHHSRWRLVRSSMHALSAVEPRARSFSDELRRRQIDRFIASVDPHVRHNLSRAELGYEFLAIERANNAATDGDLDALDIDRTQFVEHLARTIKRLQPITRARSTRS
jgi:AcrR family transcriptional regulator